jgi:VanZ family protein
VKRLVIEYWTPLVLWLVVMFFFSTDAFASGETTRLIVPVLTFFFPSSSPSQLQFWHGVIRKLGHITEYFVLAVFAYRSLTQDQPDRTYAKLRALSLVAVAAAFDEVHQHFTLYRTASPIDVGYDCLGAVWALWLISAYETRRIRTHSVL